MELFEEIFDVLAVTSFDPNESQATAAPIVEGTYEIQGDGLDWYSFNALAGDMTFTMEATAAPFDLNMTLFNANGQAIAANFDPGATETITFTAPTDGDYFLRIFTAQYANNPPSNVQMTYSLDIDLPEPVPSDGNSTFADAQPLAEGSHTITGNAVDWWKITSPSGTISLDMTTPAGAQNQDLNVVLYNSAQQVVAANINGTGNESFQYLAPADGDYFVKVFWAGAANTTSTGVPLEYTLNVDLPDVVAPNPNDPGETMATATPIAPGLHTFDTTGQDWFQFTSGPGQMNFTMNSTGGATPATVGELNMELYDSAGNVVQANFVQNGPESISFLTAEPGTYFLRVYAPQFPNGTPNGVNMNYTLDVDLPLNSWATTLDFGPARNASIVAYDIDNDGKDEIFVGTSKALDAAGNEIRPGGLIVLEDDGSVKWTKTFDAIVGVDGTTGKTYTSTSVSTQPVFSDLNADGSIDMVVGVGADNNGQFLTPGQPGDKGGIYALDANGNTLWFFQTKDVFGSALGQASDGPDGRSEGVYGTPRVFDIDADGKREVIFTSWDHRMYVLDAATGTLEFEFDLHDTTSTTPAVVDLDGDGLYEIVVPADITDNAGAGLPDQGGILHVLSNYGQPNIDGWNDQVGTSTSADFRGKFEPQALWSNPKIADLDRDGSPEIIVGTSNFFQDTRGEYIKVWNADGTLRNQLNTIGQPLAAPMLADLDGDGNLEIIAATIKGHVYAWRADGTLVFDTQVQPYNVNGGTPELPIARQPIAVDLDNDGDLELLVGIGSQVVVLDSNGTQISSTTQADMTFNTYSGSPLAHDIDGDNRLDILASGTTVAQDQTVVYRWENIVDTTSSNFRTAEYQNGQSLHDIQNFVERLYDTILGRNSDPAGNNNWTDRLYTGVLSGADVARGFINSAEFQSQGTTNAEYVNTLYSAFFGRPADAGGFNAWIAAMDNGASRADVLNGFTGSQEFANLANSFGIRAQSAFGASSDAALITGDATDTSTLRGGAGNNTLVDEGTTPQDPGNRQDIIDSGKVYRLYGATLDREPDANGFLGWLNAFEQGNLTQEQIAGGFVNSPEFQATYGALNNADFVELLYQNVLDRASDPAGRQAWLDALNSGTSRPQVVLGFSNSAEYQNNTNPKLDDFMRNVRVEWRDVIEGGAGNDVMNGGLGGDTFIFRNGQGGNDVIHGFEPWDQLQLSGFGFNTNADALSKMSQQGNNVVFSHAGQVITFVGAQMNEMSRVRYNLS